MVGYVTTSARLAGGGGLADLFPRAPRRRGIGLGTLYAITGAFASTSPILLVARALWRAARQEIHWLRNRRTD